MHELYRYISHFESLFHVHIPKTAGTFLNTSLKGRAKFINGGHCFYNGCGPVLGRRNMEGPNWPSWEDKGFKAGMCSIAIIRNPWLWLASYYLHTGSSLRGLISHSGWQGVNDYHKFKNFKDFVVSYCDPDFFWHVPCLKQGQLGQLIAPDGELKIDILLYGGAVEEFCEHFQDPKAKINRNANPRQMHANDYYEMYDNEMIDLTVAKFREFSNMTGYEFDQEELFKGADSSGYLIFTKHKC